jgi:hypothetical protein
MIAARGGEAMIALRALLGLLLCSLPVVASAHKPSDAYLTLRVEGATLHGRWDVALRDLEFAIGLDVDGDGRVTWGELRARASELDAWALARLAIASDGGSCATRAGSQLVDRHTDGAYAVLRFSADCPRAPRRLAIGYDLLFDVDPQHRGLVRVEHAGGDSTAILSDDSRRVELDLAAAAPWRTLLDYAREGVWHIWAGYDHLLFLLCLLLPSVLRREAGRWVAVEELGPALADVVRIVTAFTAAHSITLALAALGLVALPSRQVESAIAASVILAAANNLRPLVDARRWTLAFGFGLVHGLGFASVLGDLGLPRAALAPALLGFNLGVEAGQLALVTAFVPLAFALRDSVLYRHCVLAAGSVAIALLAGIWLLERSLEVVILVTS